MLIAKRKERATVDRKQALSIRCGPLRTTLAIMLVAACGGCTLSGGLIPPNPIPEMRPTDASTLTQAPMPVGQATDQQNTQPAPVLAPQPAGGLVAESELPPPTAVQPEPASTTHGSAAAFPAASRRHDTAPARQSPPPAAATIAGSPPARAEASLQTPPRQAPRGNAATIRFTPVIGAPADAIRPLSSELEASARRDGVTIRNTAGRPVDNILRGYFSATTTGRDTEIVYVWDILDAQGNMQHRIEGTEKVRGGSGKEWSAVSDSVMKKIARKTIDDYVKWRAASNS